MSEMQFKVHPITSSYTIRLKETERVEQYNA